MQRPQKRPPVYFALKKRVSRSILFRTTTPRRVRRHLFVLLVLAALAFLFRPYRNNASDDIFYPPHLPKPEGGSDPPRFYGWQVREMQLPQHDLNLPYPQGRKGRYIRFSNQACCSGWGNVMQGLLLEAHLAYLSKRTYVFQNYTWERTKGDFVFYKDNLIPARVPLTALLSGPIAGDPFPLGSGGVPAVKSEFFDQVCPNPTVIDPDGIIKALDGASAATILQTWLDKLERMEDRCVEIKAHPTQIFDIWLFGTSTRLLDIWPSYSESPIVTHFGWAPLITAALISNAPVIHPMLSSLTRYSFSPTSNPTPLSGLLALHVRHGDYIEHCVNLAHWGAGYVGFNEFPEFQDRWIPVSSVNDGAWPLAPEEQEKRTVDHYLKHCLPDIPQIVSRVREVRRQLFSTTRLTRVYVLTNGRPEWLEGLKDALREDARNGHLGEWEHISTSRDLHLTREQRHNSQMVDMAVAQRAEVFIGNGFSSLTANTAMLRAAQGYPWDKTRFW